MQRFDNTTTWFSDGESEEKLIATEQVEVQPRRSWWPRILGGVAGATALAAGTLVLVGQHTQPPAPPVGEPLAAAAPVAQAKPCNTQDPPAAQSDKADKAASVEQLAPAVAPPAEHEPEAAPVAAAEPTAAEPEEAKPARKPAASKVATRERGKHGKKPERVAPAAASPELVRAEKLMHSGQTSLALKAFQREIAKNPKETRALKGACLALEKLGRVNDAARVCRHALSLAPGDVEIRARLASIYYSGGAYKWAANEWRQVLKVRPGDLEAKRGLRQAQARL
jgi:Flp pilus assembly protein TadD